MSQAEQKKRRGSYKQQVQATGDFVIDYVESVPPGQPRWYVGRGRVAGNSSPIPSGLHTTQRMAWKAAAEVLGLTYVKLSIPRDTRQKLRGDAA